MHAYPLAISLVGWGVWNSKMLQKQVPEPQTKCQFQCMKKSPSRLLRFPVVSLERLYDKTALSFSWRLRGPAVLVSPCSWPQPLEGGRSIPRSGPSTEGSSLSFPASGDLNPLRSGPSAYRLAGSAIRSIRVQLHVFQKMLLSSTASFTLEDPIMF